MSTWKDEQTKLTATFLNNTSVAIIVAGTIAPSFALFYGTSALSQQQIDLIKIASPTFFVIGIAIHCLGRLVLRSVGRDS